MAVKLPVSYSSPSSASRVLPHRCVRSQQLRFAPTTSLSVGLGRARNPPHVFSARAAASAGDGTSSGSLPSSLANGDPASPSPASASIDFLTFCHRLKTTKRKGWINHGIKGPESIADHMYRMALMALIVGDLPGVNRERCIKIAIVHDIAEAIVGDITPSDGVPKSEKSRLEQEALNEMCEILGGGLRANEIKELWAEYENNSSIEANLVKDFDKVEMILQALEYESEHGKILDEFFLSTAGKFQTDIGKSWAAEVVRRRNKRLREQSSMVSPNKLN